MSPRLIITYETNPQFWMYNSWNFNAPKEKNVLLKHISIYCIEKHIYDKKNVLTNFLSMFINKMH